MRTFIFKLSSDTKGRPVVLLPRYNWIHCELSYLECSLACMYMHEWPICRYIQAYAIHQDEGCSCLEGVQYTKEVEVL